MTFSKAQTGTPTKIGNITITLFDGVQIGFSGEAIPTKGANYQVEVLDQDGNVMRVRGDIGDLLPHLTNADKVWLVDFMTKLRTKAVAEFINGN